MAGLEIPVSEGFSALTLAHCRALARPARELFLRIYDVVGPGPFMGGQTDLAQALGRSLRTVQRNLATLIRAGFIIERRRQRGLNAILVLHPIVSAYAAAERHQPSRPRYVRKAPRYVDRIPVTQDSAAYRVALVRRDTGGPFVPVAYIAQLLTEAEWDACVAVLLKEGRGATFFGLEHVDAELADYLQRRLKREHYRAQTLAWIALGVGRDPFQMRFTADEEEAA